MIPDPTPQLPVTDYHGLYIGEIAAIDGDTVCLEVWRTGKKRRRQSFTLPIAFVQSRNCGWRELKQKRGTHERTT